MTARDSQAQGAIRNGGRDISTRAIKSAVKAREGEVLTLLKINWQSGRPHIRCPYPNHDDRDPSWRWDGGKARAYCTCIDGSNSIFDVVMKVRGCDFEAAKLTVAEFIGRGDLIQSRGDKVRATQRTTPKAC